MAKTPATIKMTLLKLKTFFSLIRNFPIFMNDEEVSGSSGMMILVIFGSKKWLVTLVFFVEVLGQMMF